MPEAIMYVNFEDKTGKVIGISPKQDKDNSIPVELSEITALLDGKEPRRNYRVEYNAKTKQLELQHKFIQTFDGSDVNDFIYEIPENKENDPDILIEHNIFEKCWKIKIGSRLKNNLRKNNVGLNQVLYFAVTKKHDPNILYKTLSVDFSEAFSDNYAVLPFTADFEYKDIPLSVFTARKFDTYQLKRVIND
jgi:hypothetical protein